MVAPLIPERVVELVEAVRVSAVHGERALEWKRALDLSRRPRRAQVARQLIGFANRMPEDAARWFGGQACLLIGIEPGKVSGMPNADPAVIDERSGLTRAGRCGSVHSTCSPQTASFLPWLSTDHVNGTGLTD